MRPKWMWHIKRFLTPPDFELDETKATAGLIHYLSVVFIALSLVFLVILPIIDPDLTQRVTILSVLLFTTSLVILWLVRKANLRLAGFLLTLLIWLMATAGSVTAGGVSAPILMGYFIVILISGLLSKNNSNWLTTLFCIGSVLLITYAELFGKLPALREYSPVARASIYSFFILVVTVLQGITAGNLNSSLEKTRHSEQRYKSLLEGIPTITYINSPGIDSNTEYVSPQVETLLGYTREEFLKDPALWTKILHPEDRERVLQENARTVQTGELFHMEYRLVTKGGRIVWVRDEANPIYNADGILDYWLGVWTDITTQKHAQEDQAGLISAMAKRTIQLQTAADVSRAASSILDQEKLLPTVVELIRGHFDYYYVGIFLLNETGKFALLKAATGEMGNRMLSAGHHLEVGDSSMVGWCISHAQARIALDVGEDAVHFKNPLLHLTRSEIALPLSSRGEVIGAMTIQSKLPGAFSQADITAHQTMADQIANAIKNAQLFTERADLINELEGRNAELERFTYTVSHDLKSPLVTIRGFLGFLSSAVRSNDMARFDKDLGRIANAADRMQTLLNDLLELSRIGRIINQPEDIPFDKLVTETLELISGSIEERNIIVNVDKDLPIIRGDHTRLLEVIQNLISNSIKFMGDQPEPRVDIGMHGLDHDGKPIFFVRDNGIGIDPQYHQRIFGLFNRLDPNVDGTGIGLTLVKRIIEVHGGRVWVDSQLGGGATFLFTLPLAGSN